jgi:hypothetical protein
MSCRRQKVGRRRPHYRRQKPDAFARRGDIVIGNARNRQCLLRRKATGSIKLASLFLTFPTHWLTAQHVISSDG